MNIDLLKLRAFYEKAASATYAVGGKYIEPQRPGFLEMEFFEGEYDYRDSYTGYFKSFGNETIYLNKNPVWVNIYGGGMTEKYIGDKDFAHETFEFLKKSLIASQGSERFYPRGPKNFIDGNFEYMMDVSGGISEFKGVERIIYKGKHLAFTHDFMGGLVIGK